MLRWALRPAIGGGNMNSAAIERVKRVDTRDAISQFCEALPARGIIAPDDLIADGRMHRCDVDGGKRGKDLIGGPR